MMFKVNKTMLLHRTHCRKLQLYYEQHKFYSYNLHKLLVVTNTTNAVSTNMFTVWVIKKVRLYWCFMLVVKLNSLCNVLQSISIMKLALGLYFFPFWVNDNIYIQKGFK